jgi:hypothetical protein
MDVIDKVRDHAIFAGVWYVIDNRPPRDTAFEAKLSDWLASFCGESFFPYVTFVTTHWGCSDPRDLEGHKKRLASRKEQWKPFIDGGAETYQQRQNI